MSSAGCGDRLRDTINDIHQSELSGSDKKGLLRFAVGAHMAGGVKHQRVGDEVGIGPFERLESALQAAGCGTKVNISTAKQILRDKGAPELASRLSRLSKFRSSRAHPDVSLVTDICNTMLYSPAQEDTSGQVSETGTAAPFDELYYDLDFRLQKLGANLKKKEPTANFDTKSKTENKHKLATKTAYLKEEIAELFSPLSLPHLSQEEAQLKTYVANLAADLNLHSKASQFQAEREELISTNSRLNLDVAKLNANVAMLRSTMWTSKRKSRSLTTTLPQISICTARHPSFRPRGRRPSAITRGSTWRLPSSMQMKPMLRSTRRTSKS